MSFSVPRIIDRFSVDNADVKLCVIDVKDVLENPEEIFSTLSAGLGDTIRRAQSFVLLNKLDSSERGPISQLELVRCATERCGATGAWAVSLRTGEGVDAFLDELGALVREKYVLNLPDRFFVSCSIAPIGLP